MRDGGQPQPSIGCEFVRHRWASLSPCFASAGSPTGKMVPTLGEARRDRTLAEALSAEYSHELDRILL